MLSTILPGGAASATPSEAELDRRITAAAQRLEVVIERFNNVREDLRDTATQQRALGGRLAPLETDLADRQRVLGGIAASLYRQNVRGPSLTLLGARTPEQFMDSLLTLHHVDTEQRQATADLTVARERLDATRRRLDALAGQQRRQQAQLAATRAGIEAEIGGLQRLRQRAYGGGYRLAASVDLPPPPYVAGPAGAAVAFAFRQLGKPYRWGADGPNAYDCSGLTSAAWAAAGRGLPHNARRQYAATARVDRADLRPGDLVFYYGGISHVGMYVGGGKMIHAPEFGERIRIDNVDYQPVHGYGRPG